MKARKPLLRLIHISDLHICSNYSDKQMLALAGLSRRLLLRDLAESTNVANWNSGTAGHKPSAERAFERYLEQLARSDDEWIPRPKGDGPQTWLINTGDVSALGDEGSIDYALQRFEHWRAILGHCQGRCLYGNHDAWPGVQPALLMGMDGDVEPQRRQLVGSKPQWRTQDWLSPLTAGGPDGPTIEFYALNTTSFGRLDNYLAFGSVDGRELEKLCAAIAARGRNRAYRILGTHHPLVFPYTTGNRAPAFMRGMILRNADEVIHRLKNDHGLAPGLGIQPYVHLVLSGHTHFGYPGEPLLPDVGECYQGELGPLQLQLVAGSLLQARDLRTIRENYLSRLVQSDASGFAQTRLLEANNQFQVLKFYYREDQPRLIELCREVIVNNPNDISGFTNQEGLASTTLLPF